MSDFQDPSHDAIVERLRAFASQPVDGPTASQHLTAMAVEPVRSRRWAGAGSKLKVGAAFAAGLLLGGTGLATAGAMGPLQPAAHIALAKVNVEVPEGKGKADKADKSDKADKGGNVERNTTDCVGAAAGARNHGQAVKQAREAGEDHKAVATSDCGKPVHGDREEDSTVEPEQEAKPEAHEGKPADAGKSSDAGKPETLPAAPPAADSTDDADTGDAPAREAKADKAKGRSGDKPAEPEAGAETDRDAETDADAGNGAEAPGEAPAE